MIWFILLAWLILAVFGWSLLKAASDADDKLDEWLAEDDERRAPNWRRI
jgi:hypothetical protein